MTFTQRRDRHNRLFGERVSYNMTQMRRQDEQNPLSFKTSPYHHNHEKEKIPSDSHYYRRERSNENFSKHGRHDLQKQLNPKEVSSSVRLPQLQWREKDKPTHTKNPDSAESLRSRRPPLERNLDKESFPPPNPAIPNTEEIMEELTDVTVRYIHCPDPAESASRRGIVIEEEPIDLMANTATYIREAADPLAWLTKALRTLWRLVYPKTYLNLRETDLHQLGHHPKNAEAGLQRRNQEATAP
ncbi:unnamed protein product [Arabis nemorensis]|uniref:Uncharacterized protein n=1 Tax=Arabis nemorensis TaxID=586526 RepID=A0A565BLB6_9BRAS|nr:unnamed protein product [Arabis nemorensis]